MARPVLAQIRGLWSQMLQTAVFLVGAILLFVLTPPRLTAADENSSVVHAAQFIGAIIIVLALVTAHRKRWSVQWLSIATVGSLAGAVTSWFAYRLLAGIWTCNAYDGRGPIVIGGRMFQEAQQYAHRSGRSGCEMVQDAAGDTASIWPYADLLVRHLALTALFIVTTMLFLLSAVLAIEILRASTDRRV